MISSPLLFERRAGAITLTNFEGYKPFQYRALMPLVIRGIESATPGMIKDSITKLAAPKIKAKLDQQIEPAYKFESISQYIFRTVLYISLNILLMLLFMIALRYLAGAFGCFPEIVSDLLPLGLIFIMPLFYDYSVYVYDFCHLFLFTLCLYLLYKRNWAWYIIVFTLGVLNKETAIMLALVFFFYYFSKLSKPLFYRLLAAQIIIFIAIKSILYLVFVNNPGVICEWQLSRNLEHLSIIANYFNFKPPDTGMLMPFAIDLPMPVGLNLPMLALIIVSVVYKWKEKPIFLRKATIYFSLTLILAITMGCIDELKAYYDALPIIYLLGMIGVAKISRNFKAIMIRT